MQQEFLDSLCALIDGASDDEDDRLVDAAKSAVLNGQFRLTVVIVYCRWYANNFDKFEGVYVCVGLLVFW